MQIEGIFGEGLDPRSIGAPSYLMQIIRFLPAMRTIIDVQVASNF